jgi:hypothetical protein
LAYWTPDRLIGTRRYPVLDKAAPQAQAVVARGRAALAERGMCLLDGFVAEEAMAAMAAEARALIPLAHRRDEMKGAWPDAGDGALAPDHPRRRRHRSRHGTIGYDQLGADSPIRALYEWDGLTRLVAALTGEPVLHRCADPLVACVVTVLGDGDAHAWHYDDNDFVVSLLLQSAEQGGVFEYAPDIRGEDDENYEAVRRVFDGERSAVVAEPLAPGTLSLFRGRRSLHHVTQVSGRRERLIALFSYDRRPGMVFRPEVHLSTLGRTLMPAVMRTCVGPHPSTGSG